MALIKSSCVLFSLPGILLHTSKADFPSAPVSPLAPVSPFSPWSPLAPGSPLSPLNSGSPFNSSLFKLNVYVLPYSPSSFSVILMPFSAFNTSFKEAAVNTGLVVDVAPSPLPPVVKVNWPLSFPPKVIFIVG